MLKGLGLIPLDDELGSDGNGVLRHTMTDQGIRAATLEAPVRHVAIRSLLITPEPGVGIDQLDLRNCTVHDHGLCRIEGCRERVMGLYRHRNYDKTQTNDEHHYRQAHSHMLFLLSLFKLANA